ncbi:hypothetical protein FB451DRAFT_1273003 [Mycena latifolia]|nr:hypothetical protein FB451DRAFT_1273003 [Mycena latifolia]
MSLILETASSAGNSPALARALPYIKAGASVIISSSLAIFRASFAALAFITKVVAHPLVFLSPFPFVLYILAPVIVFVHLFLDTAVYKPYRVIVYLSDALYPAYIFLGVACIAGALMGLSGRLAVLGVVYVLPPAPSPISVDSQEEKSKRIS